MLQLTPEATAQQRAAIVDGLNALPGEIPGLLEAHAGQDAGLREGNADITFRMVFAEKSAWEAYGTHPAHLAVIKDRIAPVLSSKLFAQVEKP
nr:Dabb family protein [Kineosporia babensis]